MYLSDTAHGVTSKWPAFPGLRGQVGEMSQTGKAEQMILNGGVQIGTCSKLEALEEVRIGVIHSKDSASSLAPIQGTMGSLLGVGEFCQL